MPEDLGFDPEQMVARFRERAAAVRRRGIPPVEGAERRRFIEQAQLDYLDFAMIGDASVRLSDGILTLTVDLRPQPEAAHPPTDSAAPSADSTQPANGRTA
jgi:hypothetical protein